jgi:integrase/recombinase XerD
MDAHRVHVEMFAREMEVAGLPPATVARRLAALSGFYAYAEDEELIVRSPVRRVRRPRTSDKSPRLGVDRKQLRRLLDVAEGDGLRSHALACLLGLNGLRISETLALDLDDFAHERDTARSR